MRLSGIQENAAICVSLISPAGKKIPPIVHIDAVWEDDAER